jgi:hypothetical protein
MMMIIIQFNSILYYLCAESTATGPITDASQYRYKYIMIIIIIIMYLVRNLMSVRVTDYRL